MLIIAFSSYSQKTRKATNFKLNVFIFILSKSGKNLKFPTWFFNLAKLTQSSLIFKNIQTTVREIFLKNFSKNGIITDI